MAKWELDNMFITDTTNDTKGIFETTDLSTALNHPRVKEITIDDEGNIFISLSDVVVAKDEVIRKTEGLHKANKTGFRRVSVSGNKYRADICKGGTQTFLGYYEAFSEAVKATEAAEMEDSL